MKEKISKNQIINFQKHWCLVVLPLIIYSFFAFKEITLPGLYMDSVNPDYQAIWLVRGVNHIPAWLFPDNFLAGQYRLPLLNSLYGGNASAYLGLLFFGVTGFGLGEVRVFHALLGLLVLVSLSWAMHKWKISRIASATALCLLALDPTFLFAWRTQHYLQLVPVIFMATGMGILGEHYQRVQSSAASSRLLLLAGVFLGFAAYSYFIFFFYAAAIVTLYIVSLRRQLPMRSIAIPLVAGTALGWLPYLYAHLSIILNTNFQTYLDMLQGLQTAYGVVDRAQGGLIERIHIVLERLRYLVAGHSMQMWIFGDWKGSSFSNIAHLLILAIGPVTCLVYFIGRMVRVNGGVKSADSSHAGLFVKLLAAIFAIHIVVGLIIGRPLNLQHYVMLLPVLYAMAAVGFGYLLQSLVAMQRHQHATSGAMLTLGLGLIAINFSLSGGVIERLKQTGGVKLYSDAINVAASHIETLSPDTVLLFPQWGYWMGIVTITGPRFSAYEAPSLNDMQTRLTHDAALQKQQSFALVVGADFLNDGPAQAHGKLQEFAKASGLVIGNITDCQGRNGIDQLWLVQMKRVQAATSAK